MKLHVARRVDNDGKYKLNFQLTLDNFERALADIHDLWSVPFFRYLQSESEKSSYKYQRWTLAEITDITITQEFKKIFHLRNMESQLKHSCSEVKNLLNYLKELDNDEVIEY